MKVSIPAPRDEVWILTLPALARESGPLHGPFPLASFGNERLRVYSSVEIEYCWDMRLG